ncbi:hypothetical protein PCASD_20465 [Puccinia coronata f. sp. avenae]|uniref:F-box domain-containing protein n=1 Tax=Puccinia coronata f. sp. avenae TaxID=200324 RepID=A0A2N5TVT0_9BASI|nr:hypothetical protein PCASD_20465 [Puccinia coronata f. sp. avenae]
MSLQATSEVQLAAVPIPSATIFCVGSRIVLPVETCLLARRHCNLTRRTIHELNLPHFNRTSEKMMAIQRNHPALAHAPKSMPVLPHEVLEMIFQAFETLISLEESISTVRPEWHAPGSLHCSFEANYVRLTEVLNPHWTSISLISQLWYKAVSARRHKIATTIKSSSLPSQSQLTLALRMRKKITRISAQIDGDEAFAHICRLNKIHPLESITLFQVGQKLQPSLQSWDSLSQVKHLRELRIHYPLSIPLSSVLKVLNSALNLQLLEIYSFEETPSPQPLDPSIDNFPGFNEERLQRVLKHLTCHFSLPWHPREPCNSLVSLLTRGILPRNVLTLVFEKIFSTPDQDGTVRNEDERVGIQDFSAEGLRKAFRNCRNVKTLRVSAPDEMFSIPFIDQIIDTFQTIENLHLKGNIFSPLLFTTNVLPKSLKKIECQAYSSPILPLLRAARHSLTHLTNLQSLTITTYRRRPRNFAEALYNQLGLPLPAEELTREEPLSWDLTPTETLVEQQLLTQECQLRSITIDGPRVYVPPIL